MRPNEIPREQIEAELEIANRVPFLRELARLLAHAPSDEALDRIAERNPDRWAQTLAILGRLTGFTDKLQVDATLTQQLHTLSDSELQERLATLEAAAATPTRAAGSPG